MKQKFILLFGVLLSFFLMEDVNAIRCSYKVTSNCNVVISTEDSKTIFKLIEGSGTECNNMYFSFDINENNFFNNGVFQCANLYQSTVISQGRDSGSKITTGDRHDYAHGTTPIILTATFLEDEPVGGDGDDFMPGHENDKYAGIETCTDVDVNYIKACGCIPAEVADITSKVYFILRLLGPIILLIIGSFDMAKAVVTQDEKSIAKAQKKLVNKFVAAAAIFLVLTIIKFAVGIVADDVSGIFKCIDILLDGYVI